MLITVKLTQNLKFIPKKNAEDEEEALKKEEERMNKKLSRTAPAGATQTGGLSPALQQPHWNPQAPKQTNSYAQPSVQKKPVSHASYSNSSPSYGSSSDVCQCGGYSQGKFCQTCGARIIQRTNYGDIDTRSSVAPRNQEDEAEALRKEEERMTKKIGNTGAPINSYSQNQSSPNPSRFQITESIQEDIVEEVVLPVRNMGISGPGTFCTYDVPGNPQYGLEDRPRIAVDQSDTYLFTPTPGKLDFSVECLVEGSDLIKFKLTTSNDALYIQKYSMPFSFGRQHLKRIGNAIQLDPFY